MQVILKEKVENLGVLGDIVNVKPGYARNFLIPFGKAVQATKANIETFEAQKLNLKKLKKRDLMQQLVLLKLSKTKFTQLLLKLVKVVNYLVLLVLLKLLKLYLKLLEKKSRRVKFVCQKV